MMLQRSMTGSGHLNPTVHVPPWFPLNPTAGIDYPLPLSTTAATGGGVLDEAALSALRICLTHDRAAEDDADVSLVDAYASDAFRMYEFKVRPCTRGRNHDWTECPFAHPGEKARRRDPLKHRYWGSPCPAFRKAGGCKRGDACEFAHGVFECWLHPDRYRTQPCKDGTACRRRVCFFAHTPKQLRVVTPRSMADASAETTVDVYDGSLAGRLKTLVSSPTSTLNSPPKSPPIESPPISPNKWQAGSPVNDIVASLRQLQIGSKSITGSCGFASPRGASSGFNHAFCSLPSTPTATATGCLNDAAAAAAAAERVESGRALRVRMFEKLSKDAKWEKPEAGVPDVTWVSDLLK